jgi:hypothetical protein
MFNVLFFVIRLKFSLRLIFDGKDDVSHEPIAQSSFSYTFSNDDQHKVSKFLFE